MDFTINIDKFNFAEKPNPQRISRDYAAEYVRKLVGDESAERQTGDNQLRLALEGEEKARQDADDEITRSITDETSARSTEDKKIREDLESETLARHAADNILQSNIDQEAAARETADETLQVNKADKATTLLGYGISDAYTKSETDSKIAAIVDSAPDTLNTLKELADALGKDANFATTVTEQIGKKIDKSDSLYLADLRKRSNSSTGKKWDLINFVNTSDVSKKTEIIVPSYISDLKNDSDFIEEFIVAFTGDIENLTSQIRYDDIYSAYNQGKRIYGIWNHVDTGDLLFELVKFGEDGLGYEGIVGMGIPFVFEHKSTTSDGNLYFIKIKVYQAMGGTGTSFEVVESDISSGGGVSDGTDTLLKNKTIEFLGDLQYVDGHTFTATTDDISWDKLYYADRCCIYDPGDREIYLQKVLVGHNIVFRGVTDRQYVVTITCAYDDGGSIICTGSVDKGDTYTKTEMDDLLKDKVDKIDTFYLARPSRMYNMNSNKDNPCISFAVDGTIQQLVIPAYMSDLINDLDADGNPPASGGYYSKPETESLLNEKADKTQIETDYISYIGGFSFMTQNNKTYRYLSEDGLESIRFSFDDGIYENDYTAELSFNSGETPTTVSYADSGILNWLGTDCSIIDGYSVFAPTANKHYDIVFYFNGTCFVGLVNGFEMATVNNNGV